MALNQSGYRLSPQPVYTDTFDKLPSDLQIRVRRAEGELAVTPYSLPSEVVANSNGPLRRRRVRDWWIIYRVDEPDKVIYLDWLIQSLYAP
jgi:hypothetical protein